MWMMVLPVVSTVGLILAVLLVGGGSARTYYYPSQVVKRHR